jgi:virulence-associated protein VagC
MERERLHELLGKQVIALPDEFRFDVETVYLVRDGITLRVIPANEEGERLLREELRSLLTDPERVARRRQTMKPPPTNPSDSPER